ncbi:MAG: OmpA family protein [Salibacteraceae bacterium]
MKILTTLILFLLTLVGQAQVRFEFSAIKPLPEHINSPFEESCPMYDATTGRLYFTRTLHPENKGGKDLGQDLWYVDRLGKTWGAPANDLEKLNNYLNNSAIGISEDGQRLYLVGTYIKKVNLQTGFSMANKEEDAWSRPEALDMPSLNIKTPMFYGGFVTPAEDIMIISMNNKNSLGEEDLFVSLKSDNGWSQPIWLGDSINTTGFEISPFLFDDGKTLLFASTGHGGFGNADIFYAYRKDSTWTNWTTPTNAGDKINSAGFDAFPFAVGSELYFASNRNDSLSDIYTAENEQYYQDADTVQIVFESYGNRISEVEGKVRSAEDENIGTFFSNNSGIMNVPRLKERKAYRIKPKHSDIDLSVTEAYVINKSGEYIEALKRDEDGTLTIHPLSPEKLAQAKTIQKPEFVTGMRGIFEVDRVPVKNVALALTDSTGKTLQYATTDKFGKFSFAESPDSLTLEIKVLSSLEYIKQNGVIYYTDEQWNKLFKTMANAEGGFKYQKIQAQELGRLKMLSQADTKMENNQASASGVFKYDNLPQEGVKLFLYDENNNLIEEVITDENGQFQFKKLSSDKDFKIKPADEAYQDGSLVFTDKQGNELNALKGGSFGFDYRALNADIRKGLMLLEEEDSGGSIAQNFVFSIGLFKYKNLAKEGITLRLLDENDNIVETVTSDENGHFVFSMLKPERNYKVQVVGIDDSELINSQLYFVDKDGTVTTGKLDKDKDKYNFRELNADYFFSISQVNDGETELIITESFKDVIGRFKYENLGKEGVLLELLDENNKVIETIYTDENGEFRFKQLAKESNYFVRVAEQDAGLLDAGSFQMMNENNEPLVQEELTEEGFKFVTLPRSKDDLANMESSGQDRLDVSKFLNDQDAGKGKKAPNERVTHGMPTGESTALTGMKNDLKLKTLFFNFNSVRLSNYDRFHINNSVYQKVKKTGQPVLIVGYTCDLGTEEVNKKVALERAEKVKEYLITLGMDEGLIEIDGVAPDLSIKMTHGERLESRKVDIFHLAP